MKHKDLLRHVVVGLFMLFVFGGPLFASKPARCYIYVLMQNANRQLPGAPVNAECPDEIHTVPFGNWGVASPYGAKVDGHQFDGWCHNAYLCNNFGYCDNYCNDGWYEWNSCTSNPLWIAPNCDFYNSGCTSQVTTQGENIFGGVVYVKNYGCPRDTNGDNMCDAGGCAPLTSITISGAYMSLYELDLWGGDEFIQTLYYPGLVVNLTCYIMLPKNWTGN